MSKELKESNIVKAQKLVDKYTCDECGAIMKTNQINQIMTFDGWDKVCNKCCAKVKFRYRGIKE